MADVKVLFVSKYPEQSYTPRSAQPTERNGVRIFDKGHHIQFMRCPFGGKWRGEFRTSNVEDIAYLRAHEDYRKGDMYEAADTEIDRGPSPIQVKTGGSDSGKTTPDPVAVEAQAVPKKEPEAVKRPYNRKKVVA